MEGEFPELTLCGKRAIFWTLCILFAIYSVVVYTQGSNYSKGSEAYTESAEKGKLIFQEHNCISCHQIYGLGGYMGPDLTNVMSTSGKGRPFTEAFIRSGTVRMPKFDMTDDELNALLDYLEYIGQAGHYPVTDFDLTWYGTVNEKPLSDEAE